jgi:hypothetical protein
MAFGAALRANAISASRSIRYCSTGPSLDMVGRGLVPLRARTPPRPARRPIRMRSGKCRIFDFASSLSSPLSVVRTPYQGRSLSYKSLYRAGPVKLPVARCAVRLHFLVERGAGKSTRDLQIFRSPRKHFLAGRLSGLHDIVERSHRNSTSLRGFYSRWVPRPSRVLCGRAGVLTSCPSSQCLESRDSPR